MRFGVCTGIAHAHVLAQAGYDYIELSVAGDLMPEAGELEWRARRRVIEAMPLRPETFNSFVRTARIIGPEADFAFLRHYVDTALTRAAQVGGHVIVFGSGGARSIPEGFPRAEAERQMTDFLHLCADASDRTGVIVAIEPLWRAECNFIHCVREGAEWVRRIGRAGVRCLADTFHMEQENEPLSVLLECADVLAHVHTADTDRLAPGTGHYDHSTLFRTLLAARYDRRLSIECHWRNLPEEAGPALDHLRQACAAARALS
ncbi:MAG: sugar phosphate isomerase/epimerase family protein [Chloroherpetonaceae bacterium]|nr:sugar phosphate isomerase/epimerase [Chthonomonadaceae bacterium]MDW8206234.1 sugar phosphate isomerase/epimerase family protein [Chloroherpetonaceae bacterium]